MPVYSEEASQLKVQGLRHYLTKHHTPIVDAPESAMVVQNRLLFLKNMQRAVSHLQERGVPHAECLRCPVFLDYVLGADPGKACEEVSALLQTHGLAYPFVIKLLQASRTAHAHSFFVVNDHSGLREALAFEGF